MRSSYNADRYHRKTVRLGNFDYSTRAAYFITIRAADEMPPFASIEHGSLRLTDAGRIVSREWSRLQGRFDRVRVDQFIVMPDHFHGILLLATAVENTAVDQPPLSLPKVIQAYKSLTTRAYSAGVRESGYPPFSAKMWQRNYYEHIIGSRNELEAIRRYIRENPKRWYERDNPPSNMNI